MQALTAFLPVIATTAGVRLADVRRRHARVSRALCIQTGTELDLGAATGGGIAYRAPSDATCSGIGDGEVDVVFSNSVLEHVPPDVIAAMYRESRRVLVPGGAMFHSVNCGDHYAYVDRRVSQLNYLSYSDRAWSRWNNAFLYQNRMRAHEFVEGARAAGFEIILDTATARPERLRDLARVRVHLQFRHVPAEKLCITSVDFIGRTPAREDARLLTARGAGCRRR
jgi:hypothetical protein